MTARYGFDFADRESSLEGDDEMRSLGLTMVLLLAIVTSACEGGMIVRGELVARSGQPLESCVLNLYSERKGDLLESISVESQFDELIVVSPWLRRCQIEISCRGGQHVFQSPVYELDGEPLDLGRVAL